MSYMRKPAFW
jgi:hypothetical protein